VLILQLLTENMIALKIGENFMSRNALKLIAALALLTISTVSAFAQPAPTAAQKFNIRNAAGETITLTAPTSGVTSHMLTFPAALPSVAGQVLSVSTGGILSWIAPSSGSGTVTSVGLTMPSIFSVAGSPITTSGTLGVTLNNQSGNVVFASPANGSSGAPAFRSLVAADIPSGLPYLTSFSAGNLSPLFTTSVATPTTTPALSFDLTDQAANMVFAGPTSGGAADPTFRALVATDIPDLSGSYIQNQTALQSSSNFHISGNGQIEGTLGIKGTSTGFTNFTGGAQGATTINYTLPTAQATAANMVLTNNGSGALSWTDLNTLNVQYAQNQFDDFVMDDLGSSGALSHSEYSYVVSNADIETDATGNDYFGRVICETFGTGTSDDGWIASGGNDNKIRVGGKIFLFETRVRLEDVNLSSQTQQSYTGFMNYGSGNSPTKGDPAAGIFFKHNDDVSANWQVVTRNASTSTTTTTTVAVTADQWYKLRFIVNAAGSQVDFYIDDVLVASHTTNIPTSTTGMRIVAKTEKTSGDTDMTFSTDWWLTKMIR
jgi:hypothetical protein